MKRNFLSVLYVVGMLWLAGCATNKQVAPAVPADPIRGVWITNVASQVLNSRAEIKKGIALCKKNGLNHVFVVVWNQGKTLHPSKVVEKHIGVLQDERYHGRDPLQEIIEEAHAENIKVHAWFEFGFSYSYNDSNSVWRQKFPEWAGRNNKGELLKKNNFYWWSSLRPDVQSLLRDMVSELVKKYDVDGVQGDDRMPAMPGEGGYDAYSLQLYAREHNGANPPHNPFDSAWIQWKADKMSAFAKSVYQAVKKIKPACTVSWAPSIYPWSKEQYLQDWPKWLQEGYADYIIPQMYRYNIEAYEKLLKELETQVPATLRSRVFPGVLTSLGDGYQSSREMTSKMIDLNRKYGYQGEIFFYFETLNRLGGDLYQ